MADNDLGDGQAGFTLLEMLVALVVLGLLLVGLTGGVRAGLSLRQAQIHRLSGAAELDAAMRALRTVMSRLPVVSGGNRVIATEAGAGFTGGADRVSFVGDMPTGLGATRRADITIRLGSGRLVLSWAPHYHERSLGPPRQPIDTVLLDGVERLDFAYWGAPVAGQPPAWHPRWESPDAPELIRVRLIFAKADPRHWPDLITAARF